MAIPDYQTVMLPLLRFASERKAEISTRDAVETLSKQFKLSDDELRELLPSGTQPTFANRVGWAATYMKKAGLLETTRRGFYRATKRAEDILAKNPKRIDAVFLRQFPEFMDFAKLKGTRKRNGEEETEEQDTDNQKTPLESIESAYQRLRQELASDILERLKNSPPSFFERVVVELLVKMGYGGSRADAGRAVGRSGDGGIDGIIKEDKLGLDAIYIQAKRWGDKVIGRPELQQFTGALEEQKASKGVFITTSRFTKEACDYVKNIRSKIVLIDGETLAQYMIDHELGVSRQVSYDIKRIDSDYFDDAD